MTSVAGRSAAGLRDGGFDDAIDVEAYFDRIGFSGPREPTYGALREIVRRHMATIPFEAVDALLGRGVDLAPAVVDRKLLAGRRGGYCFEHASLTRRALRAIGFRVEQHLARVRVHDDGPDAPTTAATHASLKVEIDGRTWLVDVGFGGHAPDEPIPWRTLAPWPTRFGEFRLIDTPDGRLLQSLREGRWTPLYEILDFHWREADFKVANHYTATFPGSRFRNVLMAARTGDEGRTTLLGNRLRRAGADGSREERTLDADGLAEALAADFGLPVADDWLPTIARIAAAPTPDG